MDKYIVFITGLGKPKPENHIHAFDYFTKISSIITKCYPHIKCVIYAHPKSVTNNINKDITIICEHIQPSHITPSIIITWTNHKNLEYYYDKFPNAIKIYGELSIFDRRRNIYFSEGGITTNSLFMDKNYTFPYKHNEHIFSTLIKSKIPFYGSVKSYIFFPLQQYYYNEHFIIIDYIKQYYPTTNIVITNHPFNPTSIDISKHLKNVSVYKGNCQTYAKHAQLVIAMDSGVLLETLCYHGNICYLRGNEMVKFSFNEKERKDILNKFYYSNMKKLDIQNENVDIFKQSYLNYIIYKTINS